MDEEFDTWDYSWFWDNNYADLSPVGLNGVSCENSKSSVPCNNSLLIDSAFCELETDSETEKDVTHLDQFRLLHTDGEGSTDHHHWTDNVSSVSLHYDGHCQSCIVGDARSDAESCSSEGFGESLSSEELETSDTESQGRSTEQDSMSSVMELSSSCSFSDTSDTFPVRDDERRENVQVTDDNMLSDGSQCTNMLGASSSNSSVGNESQSPQHQPLVFFLIGLFVGLSLGFFTCIVTMSAAVHRMHLEIVSGRTLYTECQHKRELFHRSVSSEISQVNMDVVIGSIWREKFEEMVGENAELQVKVFSLQKQMSRSLDKLQQSVAALNTELTCLKCCVDNNASSFGSDIHSVLTSDNSSSTNVTS